MDLLRLILAEARANVRNLAIMTVIAGVSTAAVLGIVNMAAADVAEAGDGGASFRLMVMFLCALALFALSQNYVMSTSAREVETIIHRIRVRLADDLRRADMDSLDHLGRGPLYAALTQDTQTISRTLPLLVVGAQQAALLVFVAIYMAWLSLTAFALAAVFGVVAIVIHLQRMQRFNHMSQRAMAHEATLFDGLGHLLKGFKEARMDTARSDAVMLDLATASAAAREAKSETKRRWAFEFVLVQLIFYILLGIMVFVVPLFTDDYHESVVSSTTAALFMIGPIGTIAQAIPNIADANTALAGIQALQARLREYLGGVEDETSAPLSETIKTIELRDLAFTYTTPRGGAGFRAGPLRARFQAGEITFITGGNGSGKSTMMRLLTGLLPAQSGDIVVNGVPLSRVQFQAYRDQMSAIFSDYHVFRRLFGVGEIAPERAAKLLDLLDMTDKVAIADGAFSTVDLSVGQRKRLALVVAALEDNPVLILDEWAADQDPHFRKVFYERILPDLRDQGKMLICVTHDDRYFHLADRILHMSDGRIVPQDATGGSLS